MKHSWGENMICVSCGVPNSPTNDNSECYPKIPVGNTTGIYFTQWRFDLLSELLDRIKNGPMPGQSRQVVVESPILDYDREHDFHHLRFMTDGKKVDIRLYKVFAVEIDGQDLGMRCPRSQVWDCSIAIRKSLMTPAGETS